MKSFLINYYIGSNAINPNIPIYIGGITYINEIILSQYAIDATDIEYNNNPHSLTIILRLSGIHLLRNN